jgi:hypothetical protein
METKGYTAADSIRSESESVAISKAVYYYANVRVEHKGQRTCKDGFSSYARISLRVGT